VVKKVPPKAVNLTSGKLEDVHTSAALTQSPCKVATGSAEIPHRGQDAL
jgi:hypothetical protein